MTYKSRDSDSGRTTREWLRDSLTTTLTFARRAGRSASPAELAPTDKQPEVKIPDPLLGKIFDGPKDANHKPTKYELVEKLNNGNQAVIYIAKRSDSNVRPKTPDRFAPEVVAIKVLGNGPAAFLDRFETEAALLGKLDHPNVIKIFHYGRNTETAKSYMVLEYFKGKPIDEVIVPPASWKEIVRPVLKAVDGIIAAHGAGVLHRDINPTSILLSDDRATVKIVDFGFGSDLTGQGITQDGQAMGTIAYMAPEIFAGTKPDKRSDVYSLGVVLYQLLSGEFPYNENELKRPGPLLTERKEKVPISILTRRPDLFRTNHSRSIANIVDKALAKNPDERYQSGQELKNALEEIGKPSSFSLRRTGKYAALTSAIAAIAAFVFLPNISKLLHHPVSKPNPVFLAPKTVTFEVDLTSKVKTLKLGNFEIIDAHGTVYSVDDNGKCTISNQQDGVSNHFEIRYEIIKKGQVSYKIVDSFDAVPSEGKPVKIELSRVKLEKADALPRRPKPPVQTMQFSYEDTVEAQDPVPTKETPDGGEK